MTIRYTNFADGDVLTAEQMLDVQDNGVVQVTSFSELSTLAATINTAYVTADSAFYVKKGDGSWGSVGGLAAVSASAPSTPQTGQLWFDTDLIINDPVNHVKSGSTTITATSFATVPGWQHYDLTVEEPMICTIVYGFADGTGAAATDGLTVKVDVSGATTRLAGAEDYVNATGTTFGTRTNTITTTLNAGVNTITMEAKKNSTGATTASSLFIKIIPIRWA
jgi:hypothetical protein